MQPPGIFESNQHCVIRYYKPNLSDYQPVSGFLNSSASCVLFKMFFLKPRPSGYNGSIRQAPWDKTGLSGPDCLMCHRKGNYQGSLEKSLEWCQSTLAAGETLKDNSGKPVAAFSAAATAGQGWFSNLQE
jgi:hypothetical protein